MSLYLKYRPRDFNSLVGQNFIKQTLQNALSQDKLVGAYLFTGPRGTGKTSTARILALGMNCLSEKNKPCYHCEICSAFQEGRLTDIIEIDAASNTGVDNIREIIERAQFVPNRTRYKVYIIDEVHMLSKGAFNALLKILEEPPIHVKFILATTEIHKVLETILSRCQRYDFKSISDSDVQERLSFIASEESIQIDEKSLLYIIKNARGGLRNAINLFEQLIIDGKIEYTYIIDSLGITEFDTIQTIGEKIIKNDSSLLYDFQNLIEGGKNIRLFFKDLIFFLRDKMIEEMKEKKNISRYIKVIEILDETYTKSKNSFDEYTTLLTGILRTLEGKINTSEKVSELTHTELNSIEKTVPSPQKKEIPTELKENPLSLDDMNEVFGAELGENKVISTFSGNSDDFSKEVFISKIKESGAKGSIIISLKGAQFSFVGDELTIKAATNIAKGSLEVDKNIGLYRGALASMGYANIHLKF